MERISVPAMAATATFGAPAIWALRNQFRETRLLGTLGT